VIAHDIYLSQEAGYYANNAERTGIPVATIPIPGEDQRQQREGNMIGRPPGNSNQRTDDEQPY
jgi:hypothetical protein